MYPIINIFGFEVQTYSVLAALGFVLTAMLAVKLGKLKNISAEKSLMATLVSAFGVFVGGYILFALTNIKSIVNVISESGFSLADLMPYISGMVFYGGLIGAIIVLFVYTAVSKDVKRQDVFDVFAVTAPFFHIFGRVGCFFAGCCYGVESEFGIITYNNTSPTHYGVSRFPVALLEAFVNLLIFVLLLYLFKRNKLGGKLIFVYLLVYAPARFVLEFFRGDNIRGFVFGLSTSQFISILIIAFVCVYSLVLYFKKKSKSKSL